MPCEPFVDQLEIELLGPEMADLFCCVSELCLLEYRNSTKFARNCQMYTLFCTRKPEMVEHFPVN